ncbi:MAG TPA: hypothetical protein VHS81_00155 [Caulobacteraceae bacterium]|jgi:hypothetical protein|nr:hypothetical protein [Caulobacteraceae bacterium]
MQTKPAALGAFAPALVLLMTAAPAAAHGIVGDRFFPATLVTDDPAVADELTLPQVAGSKTADDPPATQIDISGEWSKRITSNFGVSFDGAWTDLKTPGGVDVAGFQNFGTTFKYQALTDAPHELMISVGLAAEWGGTGAQRVGADRTSTLTPTLYFGKGANDLPDSLWWAKPLALTGVIGYAVPLAHDAPRALESGFALEYSFRYLAAHVRDVGLPSFVNQLTPLVEVQLATPIADRQPSTGTINPGIIWSGNRVQFGLEAMAPINRASGRTVGAVFQVHWFLDDMFPHGIGRPIW